MTCITEKILTTEKLHPGMSYSAAGHEFSAHEPKVYIK